MDNYQTLAISQDARGVVSLELNLPDKRNALSAQMISELTHFAETVEDRDGARVVVMSGRGKVFCAGGDLGWMKQQIEADRETRMVEARKLALMLRTLNEMPLPLIGRIHKGAFGGGVGIACVCDVAIATSDAQFGLTETRLGLIPATIGPYVLARMGEGKARRVFMSARLFDAHEAKALDLVADVVDADAIDDRIAREIEPYLSTAPNAVAAAKRLARQLGPRIDDAVIDHSIECLADTWDGEEARQGVEAFFAKTKAPWIR